LIDTPSEVLVYILYFVYLEEPQLILREFPFCPTVSDFFQQIFVGEDSRSANPPAVSAGISGTRKFQKIYGCKYLYLGGIPGPLTVEFVKVYRGPFIKMN